MAWAGRQADSGAAIGEDVDSNATGSAPAALPGRDVWVTKDGREIAIKEMYRPHLGNAQAVITKWLKREKDPLKRRELKSWRSRMRRELVKREKAWQAERKKALANDASPQRSRNGF